MNSEQEGYSMNFVQLVFSELIIVLCILNAFVGEVINSSLINQTKINLDTNYNKNGIDEDLIDRNNYQRNIENYVIEKSHRDTDVRKTKDSLISSDSVNEGITAQETNHDKNTLSKDITDAKNIKLYSKLEDFKNRNPTFIEIIKNIVIKRWQSEATISAEESLNDDINRSENDKAGSDSSNAASINSTEIELNLTAANGTKNTNNTHTKKAFCLELEKTENIADVEILNSTVLLKLLQSNANITSRSTPANCYLIYFFSPYCPFSTQGSAYVNALARSIPNIPVYGLNSVEYHSLNARYGIMGTPSLVLFHNGLTVGRYNSSEYSTFYLESFIRHFTNEEFQSINVTSQDFKAILPTHMLKSSNLPLYIAWIFLLICACCVFLNSEFYAKLTEAFLNNWREAEAQHEHNE